jgi:hypothetical protein
MKSSSSGWTGGGRYGEVGSVTVETGDWRTGNVSTGRREVEARELTKEKRRCSRCHCQWIEIEWWPISKFETICGNPG